MLAVKLLVHCSQVRIGDVRIYLGGGDIAVAKHGLDAAQVGSVHEQIGSERMT